MTHRIATAACLVGAALLACIPELAMADDARRNVLGQPLALCCAQPKTGYLRDGFCRAVDHDHGTHTVCAVVTQAFLEFTRGRGNDLITPRPEASFPGLKPGDRWCLCALRWREAEQAQVAPPVVLAATDERTLEFVDRAVLQAHAQPAD